MSAAAYAVLGEFDWAARLPCDPWDSCHRVAHHADGNLGIRRDCRNLFWLDVHDVRRVIPVYKNFNPRRFSHRDHRLGLVGDAASTGRSRAAPALVGSLIGCSHGCRCPAEGGNCNSIPVAATVLFLLLTGQLFVARTWKRLRPISGTVILPGNRGAMVHLDYARESALFRFLPGCGSRKIPRFLLVLLL